ncbi:Uncharacterised protein at_DN0601 [Pycnogonum litorale]
MMEEMINPVRQWLATVRTEFLGKNSSGWINSTELSRSNSVNETMSATTSKEIEKGHVTLIVRKEEIVIVSVVLFLWMFVILLFINKWGKIRMLEPYLPLYKLESPIEADDLPSRVSISVDPPSTSFSRRQSNMNQFCLASVTRRLSEASFGRPQNFTRRLSEATPLRKNYCLPAEMRSSQTDNPVRRMSDISCTMSSNEYRKFSCNGNMLSESRGGDKKNDKEIDSLSDELIYNQSSSNLGASSGNRRTSDAHGSSSRVFKGYYRLSDVRNKSDSLSSPVDETCAKLPSDIFSVCTAAKKHSDSHGSTSGSSHATGSKKMLNINKGNLYKRRQSEFPIVHQSNKYNRRQSETQSQHPHRFVRRKSEAYLRSGPISKRLIDSTSQIFSSTMYLNRMYGPKLNRSRHNSVFAGSGGFQHVTEQIGSSKRAKSVDSLRTNAVKDVRSTDV